MSEKKNISFDLHQLEAITAILDIFEHDAEAADDHLEPEFSHDDFLRIHTTFSTAPRIDANTPVIIALDENTANETHLLLTKIVESVLYLDEEDCEDNEERAYTYVHNAVYTNLLAGFKKTVTPYFAL